MRVTVDGAELDVAIDGDGAPVVLLAGFPLTREIWNDAVRELSATSRAIRVDLRGTGRSSVPGGPYLMETLAGDIAAVLDILGIERVALVGHSLGGYVAMAFARMYVERVSRLALVCSRLRADTPEEALNRERLAERIDLENSTRALVEEIVPRLFAAGNAPEPGALERVTSMAAGMPARGAAAMLRGMAMRTSAEDIAEDLDLPVLVLGGDRDAIVPLDESRDAAGRFPHAALAIVEGCGHLPMLESPGPFAARLRDFLIEKGK